MEEEIIEISQTQQVINPELGIGLSVNSSKVYTKNAIAIATYFGGPLAGFYMMSENFKNFGNKEIAKKTFKIGSVATALFFLLLFIIPEYIMHNIPKFIIPFFYSYLIYYYTNKLQGKNIEEFINTGGQKNSGWKVFWVLILCNAVLVSYIVLITILKVIIFG